MNMRPSGAPKHKHTVAWHKKQLFKQVKKICRERIPCIMAEVSKCGGFIQASHIKSEGAWKNLYLDPRNIFPMCYVHHLKVWHKDPTEWGKWFEVSFPEDYKYLEKAKYKHKDFNDRMTIEKLMAAAKIGYPEYFKAYNLLKTSEIT